MKTLKKLISFMLCVLMLLSFVSCGGSGNVEETSAEPSVQVPPMINCTVTVKIGATATKAEEILIDNCPIILRDRTEWPTILDALAQACYAYDIKYSSSADGTTVGTIGKRANFENNSYWEWKRNGKTPGEDDGKAGTILVQEGDTYEFIYTVLGGE